MEVVETIPRVVTKAKTIYRMSQVEVEQAIQSWLAHERPRTGKVVDLTFEVRYDGYIITPDDVNAIVTVEEE